MSSIKLLIFPCLMVAMCWLLAFAAIAQEAKTDAAVENKAKGAVANSNAIKVDEKITETEKQNYNASAEKSDAMANKQAQAINKVPGVNVAPAELKEKEVTKKTGPSLNPVSWIFGPVIKLQQQTVRLEQQIMKLIGPIAALQPGMLKLENRMTEVNGQMGVMRGQLGNMQTEMGALRQSMNTMQSDIAITRREVQNIREPIVALKAPIMDLQKPLSELRGPLQNIVKLDQRLTSLQQELADLKILLSLVLTSIFIAAILIALGTPVAAILIWRNKNKLLPKANGEEAKSEAKIERAGKNLDRQLRKSA